MNSEAKNKTIELNEAMVKIGLKKEEAINNYKVGNYVKLLIKDIFDFESYPGRIVGIYYSNDEPIIVVAYLKQPFDRFNISYIEICPSSEDTKIEPLNDWDFPIERLSMLKRFKIEILSKEQEVTEMKSNVKRFEQIFDEYFEDKQ